MSHQPARSVGSGSTERLHVSEESVAFVFEVQRDSTATSAAVAVAATAHSGATVRSNRSVTAQLLCLDPDGTTCSGSGLSRSDAVTAVGFQQTVHFDQLKQNHYLLHNEKLNIYTYMYL